jgi:hypothetical protein
MSAATGWWSQIAGATPENMAVQQGGAIFQASGPYAGGQLGLSAMTLGEARVDLVLAAARPSIDTVGTIQHARETIWPLIEKLLSVKIPARRLAFWNAHRMDVPDLQTGYKVLSELLPSVKIDPLESSDFYYQINRPRLSSVVPGLKINRLSKWSVMAIQPMELAFSIPAPGGQTATPPQVVSSSSGKAAMFVRLESETNTASENIKPLDPTTTVKLAQELLTLESEIALRGDVP